MSLVLYPKSHRYKLDGQWVQGVTTLIKQGLPKEFLIDWAARMAAEYAADHRDALWSLNREGMIAAVKIAHKTKRDTAGARGTDVHTFAERVLKGEEVEVPEALAGYVESAVAFMEDWRIEPLVIERPLASREHRYAGKCDLIARACASHVGIFDFKTAASGIYGETALQQSAYANSEFYAAEDKTEHPIPELGIEAAYGVHLRPDGYEVIPLEFGDHVFQDFLTVAASAQVAKRVKTYALDPIEPDDLEEVA